METIPARILRHKPFPSDWISRAVCEVRISVKPALKQSINKTMVFITFFFPAPVESPSPAPSSRRGFTAACETVSRINGIMHTFWSIASSSSGHVARLRKNFCLSFIDYFKKRMEFRADSRDQGGDFGRWVFLLKHHTAVCANFSVETRPVSHPKSHFNSVSNSNPNSNSNSSSHSYPYCNSSFNPHSNSNSNKWKSSANSNSNFNSNPNSNPDLNFNSILKLKV